MKKSEWKKWSPEEEQFLKDNFNGKESIEKIANELRRTENAIYGKANELNLFETKSRLFIGDKINIQIKKLLLEEDRDTETLMEYTGLSRGGLYHRIRFLQNNNLIRSYDKKLIDMNGTSMKGRPRVLFKWIGES